MRSLHLRELTPENAGESLQHTMEMLAKRFDACDVHLFTSSPENEPATLASFPGEHATASQALLEKTASTGKARLVEDAMNCRDFAGDVAFQTFNISWAYCAPLLAGSQLHGFLYLDSRRSRAWHRFDLDLLGLVAEGLSMALQNLDLQQRLSKDELLITAGTAALHCSHSLKNLLQLIGGAAEVIELALERKEMPRVLRSWAIMQPNLHRLRRLTLDMLYYSKDRPLEKASCDLNALAKSAVDSLAIQIRQKNIRIRRNLDKAIVPMNLDSGRIHELITNLILNAADFVPENTGVIKVSTRLNRRSRLVRLTVSNNGPEMTAEQVANVFVPFHSTKQRFGTGLGLAIAKRIARQHGGTMSVKTSARNTAFTLSLPTTESLPG